MVSGTSIVTTRSPYFVRTSFTLGQQSSIIADWAEAAIKLIGPGDITDDDDLPGMGDAIVGTVTAGPYSAYHQSAVNRANVEAFKLSGCASAWLLVPPGKTRKSLMERDCLEDSARNDVGVETLA